MTRGERIRAVRWKGHVKKTPAQNAAATKAWRERNVARVRLAQHRHQIKKLYGLSVEGYDRMLLGQHGRCDICGEPMKRPMVDHDHTTGKIRALLCNGCNLTLGWLENPVKRRLFDAYLARHR